MRMQKASENRTPALNPFLCRNSLRAPIQGSLGLLNLSGSAEQKKYRFCPRSTKMWTPAPWWPPTSPSPDSFTVTRCTLVWATLVFKSRTSHKMWTTRVTYTTCSSPLRQSYLLSVKLLPFSRVNCRLMISDGNSSSNQWTVGRRTSVTPILRTTSTRVGILTSAITWVTTLTWKILTMTLHSRLMKSTFRSYKSKVVLPDWLTTYVRCSWEILFPLTKTSSTFPRLNYRAAALAQLLRTRITNRFSMTGSQSKPIQQRFPTSKTSNRLTGTLWGSSHHRRATRRSGGAWSSDRSTFSWRISKTQPSRYSSVW